MNSLSELYKEKVVKELQKELKLENAMEVPRITKIVVNAGIGNFKDVREAVESFVAELAGLTGQKPSPRKARLSEAGFKIRKGDIVGYTVTLRGAYMWAFLEKLIRVVLPRTRGFWGLSADSFDGHGNYSLGIREHTVFPEVNPNTVKGIRSLQITVGTSTKDDKEALALLKSLGFPFKKD
ncbi:MAG: 50S ribosomal protein L5 [bacterium]